MGTRLRRGSTERRENLEKWEGGEGKLVRRWRRTKIGEEAKKKEN